MNIDITGEPPSEDYIAGAIENETIKVAWGQTYVKSYSVASALILISALTVFFVWHTTPKDWFDNIVLIALLICVPMVMALLIAHESEGISDGVFLLMVPVYSVVAGVIMSVLTWSAHLGLTAIWAVVVLAIFFVWVSIGAFVINALLESKEKLGKTTKRLAELNSVKHEHQCLEYEQIVTKNSDVSIYHQKIIRMGRKPLLCEYRAAKKWRAASGARQRRKSAEEACERLSLMASS